MQDDQSEDGPKVTAEQVRQLRQKCDCGMLTAKHALIMRGGDMELAEEWIMRSGLAAFMSDRARFPKYYESIRKKVGKIFKF